MMGVKLLSTLAFFLAAFLCIPSLWNVIVKKDTSLRQALDILTFPGAIILLFCAFWVQKYAETEPDIDSGALCALLQGEEVDAGNETRVEDNVTPFAKAGFLSRMSFWWLNPLMKKGKQKVIEDEDIPKLRQADQAEICPLILKAFIGLASGKEAFKYEGYALTGGLFLAKLLESLSERQWYFRTRLIGLQIRSLFYAAIYQKQLRLSSAAKATHSSGQIMNYVTMDAYKIGEFPYWFHQIWTTLLQLCLALVIIYYSMGFATFAAFFVIIVTVLGNSPLAKLQHKYLTKLMVAQDRRLKAITEALTSMKVLKLCAWENHFKNVIEGLRKEEIKWLSAVLSQKGYYLVLFWSSPMIVSAATFWACYFVGIPLNANNVFTFLATLHIVQEPIRSIPDIAQVFIEAKVSLNRIVKFLEAPELQKRHPKEGYRLNKLEQSILISTTSISWDANSTKSTLANINLVIKPGQKVAICGEVGSGKSTLLAAILGEVSNVNGTVSVHDLFPSSNHGSDELLVSTLRLSGERGVNLSGGQKQRVQLARALYQDADIYLLDDPFSAVSSDLTILDLELAFKISPTIGSTMNAYFCSGVLAILTWPLLFVIILMVYITIMLQKFYYASAKELMRIDGTTKSSVASHLAESIAGAMTIRAFGEEDQFFSEHFQLIDANASPSFHNFSANEWLIQCLEVLCTIVVSFSALAMTLVQPDASESGFIGMALSYGLSLNVYLVFSVQSQCLLSNMIISVERLEQYMHVPSEAPEKIEGNRPPLNWPSIGRVEISDLKVRYRPNAPLVLQGISCIFEGGDKIGIVGRIGSGKTTLISALFRLVEPTEGMITVDGINISDIGLHDLRSHSAYFHQLTGTTSTDHVLKVLEKCQLRQAVQGKEEGLNSLEMGPGIKNALYAPLQDEEVETRYENSMDNDVTPFEKSGFISRMTFWWLNPLLKKGKANVIEDKDIPKLRQEDQAGMCLSFFMEQLTKQKQKSSSDGPSILSTIFVWQWKSILISGCFALIKVLALATGPLLLKAFIRVAEGKKAFEYEGYALAGGLFLAKCLESLSERQWYFRTRLIGLQVRSLLSAAVYKKQLRLSNAAKTTHSPGQIMNYATVDVYRIGEYPYWFHQIWTINLQICLALAIIYYSVGLATFAALFVIILTVLGNSPLIKLQHKYITKLMVAQDGRLKAITETLTSMKVLKLYAWETHFKNVIEGLREEELNGLSSVLSQRGYYLALYWASPIIVSAATFWACYFMGIPLNASSIFTFLATLRIVQEPIRLIPDVAAKFIEGKVSLSRIVKFLEESELQQIHIKERYPGKGIDQSIVISSTSMSWNTNSSKPTLANIDLMVKPSEKVAICGEVGSGKSTLLAAILGEVSNINGTVQVYGTIAYVSQTAWIQTGTIQENILFGSLMDEQRYQKVLDKCSLVKDLEMLPSGDGTVIGERGVNLSGGQKQRLQLARALYQDADIYLLDDPFSAVDAHTATSLFNDYVMEALSGKTVLLVTHQVDFLPAFDYVLLMSEGEILKAATYDQLLATSQEFQCLIRAHKDTAGSERHAAYVSQHRAVTSKEEIQKISAEEQWGTHPGDQLIKKEERETGDRGLMPYRQYLSQSKGFLYLSLAVAVHAAHIIGQFAQNFWLAAEVQDSSISRSKMIIIYMLIGCAMGVFLFLRSYFVVILGLGTSKSMFSTLMTSLIRAPMSFYDSTPVGRILSRVSSDLSIVDLDLAFALSLTIGTTINTYFSFGILALLTWPILCVIIPMVFTTISLQKFYFASAKELMRIDGTTKSSCASHLAESIAGAVTIRAFRQEERFFSDNLHLIDANASSYFHIFAANEWLIQRLEILCAIVVSASALAMTLVSLKASESGFIGMALSYGLSLNVFLVLSVQSQCSLSNMIISVERIEQYMHIPSEAPEIIPGNRPSFNWPSVGRVEIRDLKVRYRPNAPLVLRGISCTFEGGHKIGIVGRTGSGKTTLISALFRLVEPTEGMISIDDLNISTIGLHDLRSHLGIIPQDPTLFSGSVRYNLDPLSEHTDHEIWEVLEKCQLRQAIQETEEGLNSLVVQDGSNWSMGQRQLFCLGRALLKRRKILVLDEATASIDNATDSIIQRTIRIECTDCTVITVAHRIPTVMDCTMVLAIADGELVEYDDPMKLMNHEGSLFAQLVKEYWSHSENASVQSRN
ncbi:hypothetical protein RJ639_047387 [Escallonia herrerae]|uniref:ABC-type xenobiotic transporter n=1 Tax=Escallonia herrerae TaxID=1293975 RepID=A0AA89B0M2_9ASTE|nr:hypothetical protein RJ639_047387 [Escallonia herrerae]